MSFHAVYIVSTGGLHSIELQAPALLPDGFGCVEVAEYAGLDWDPATLTFVQPAAAASRIIPRKDFIERFTAEEWVALVALKGSDPVIAAVFERMALLPDVELDAPFTQAMAAHVVAQGYLTQERMDEVMA